MKTISSHKLPSIRHPHRAQFRAQSSTSTTFSEPRDQVTLSSAALSSSSGGTGSLADNLVNSYGTGGGPEVSARRVYSQHGAHPHDLNDRHQVGELISRTPQLDDLDGRRVVMREATEGHAAETARANTDGDQTRCGGASLFNSLLLDGNPRENADALGRVAEQRARAQRSEEGGFQVNDTQRTALQHMREGSLTPREAAVLQEMTYDMSRSTDNPRPGLSTRQIGDTLRDLRRAGALQSSPEVNVRGENHGGPIGHATVSTRRDGGGTHFANSWPQENGYATVTGRSGAAFAPGDHPERNFQTSASYQRNQGGDSSRIVYRAAAGPRNEAETRVQERDGSLPPLQIQCPVEPREGCFTPHRLYPGDMQSNLR